MSKKESSILDDEETKKAMDTTGDYEEGYDTETDKGQILKYAEKEDGAFGGAEALTVFPSKDHDWRRRTHLLKVPLDRLHRMEHEEYKRIFAKTDKAIEDDIEIQFKEEAEEATIFRKDVKTMPAIGGQRMKDFKETLNGTPVPQKKKHFWSRG